MIGVFNNRIVIYKLITGAFPNIEGTHIIVGVNDDEGADSWEYFKGAYLVLSLDIEGGDSEVASIPY